MFDFMQWPASFFSILGSWFISNDSVRQRWWGFFLFLLANFCWIIWAIPASAWAVVLTQILYVVLSIRGMLNNRPATMMDKKVKWKVRRVKFPCNALRTPTIKA